jgi:hypothetical protein
MRPFRWLGYRSLNRLPLPVIGRPSDLVSFVDLINSGYQLAAVYPVVTALVGLWSLGAAAVLVSFLIGVRRARGMRDAG